MDNLIQKQTHEECVKKAKENVWNLELIEAVSNILKILGEPSRLKIVLALNEGEMCVNHIVEAVDSSQSAVSHQLRILKDNKIIKSRREGQSVVYSLDDEHIMQIVMIAKEHLED